MLVWWWAVEVVCRSNSGVFPVHITGNDTYKMYMCFGTVGGNSAKTCTHKQSWRYKYVTPDALVLFTRRGRRVPGRGGFGRKTQRVIIPWYLEPGNEVSFLPPGTKSEYVFWSNGIIYLVYLCYKISLILLRSHWINVQFILQTFTLVNSLCSITLNSSSLVNVVCSLNLFWKFPCCRQRLDHKEKHQTTLSIVTFVWMLWPL